MTAVHTTARGCFDAIVALQRNQYDHVQSLVTKFLPNDFRTRMFIAYQKRSEAQTEEGAHSKYLALLWPFSLQVYTYMYVSLFLSLLHYYFTSLSLSSLLPFRLSFTAISPLSLLHISLSLSLFTSIPPLSFHCYFAFSPSLPFRLSFTAIPPFFHSGHLNGTPSSSSDDDMASPRSPATPFPGGRSGFTGGPLAEPMSPSSPSGNATSAVLAEGVTISSALPQPVKYVPPPQYDEKIN